MSRKKIGTSPQAIGKEDSSVALYDDLLPCDYYRTLHHRILRPQRGQAQRAPAPYRALQETPHPGTLPLRDLPIGRPPSSAPNPTPPAPHSATARPASPPTPTPMSQASTPSRKRSSYPSPPSPTESPPSPHTLAHLRLQKTTLALPLRSPPRLPAADLQNPQ
jgi:hypothetical protein